MGQRIRALELTANQSNSNLSRSVSNPLLLKVHFPAYISQTAVLLALVLLSKGRRENTANRERKKERIQAVEVEKNKMAVAGLYRRILPSPPAVDLSSLEGKVISHFPLTPPFSILESFRS